MIFIWGSYARQASLHESAMCARCNRMQPVSFQRVWRTGHFFFFPLFSWGHAMLSRCEACKREGVADFPHVLPKLPLLDRLGWLFPIGAIGLVLTLFIGTIAMAPPPKPRTAEEKAGAALRMRLDRELSNAASPVGTEDEMKLEFFTARALPAADSLRVLAKSWAVDGHRRVVVLVQRNDLRRIEDAERLAMLEHIRVALAGELAPDDEVLVAMRGTLLYGALAQGPVGQPWSNPRVGPAMTDELEAALGSFAISLPN